MIWKWTFAIMWSMSIGVTILGNILLRGRDHIFIISDIMLIVSPISLNSGSFNATFSFLPVLGTKMQIAIFEVFKISFNAGLADYSADWGLESTE